MNSGPDLGGGRPGPSGIFGISERDWLSNYSVLKIEGFGGRPPVGRVSHAVTKRAVGEWCQCLPLVFVLQENILSTCCNGDDVM